MINIIGIRDSGKSKEKISAYLDKIPSEKGSEIKEYKAVFQNFGVKNAMHSFLDTQPQPFVSPDKRFYAFAEGEIYDCPKGNRSLECLFQNFLLNKFNG